MKTRTSKHAFLLASTVALLTLACGGGDVMDSEADVRNASQELGSPNPTPTNISTLNQLNTTVRNNPTGNFRLTAHIDMAPAASWNGGLGWTPISNFSGTFDGNGYQIRNLTMNRPQQWGVGLFAQTSAAIVKNVGLTNVNITGNGWVGGLAGMLTASQVTSSYVEGTVTGGVNQFGPAFNLGLFAGLIDGSDVGRSYARGTVNGAFTLAGGFAGTVQAAYNGRSVIHECYARADVLPDMTSSTVISGGIAGRLYGSTATNVYALNQTTNGGVRGRGYVGGLFGDLDGDHVIFNFSYSRNTVTDWAVPWPNHKAGTYGKLSGNTSHFGSVFWDTTVDNGQVYELVGHYGFSSNVLRTPTATTQYPYDNGTDSDWDPAEWNCGTSSQYNVLRNVVRPTVQSTN